MYTFIYRYLTIPQTNIHVLICAAQRAFIYGGLANGYISACNMYIAYPHSTNSREDMRLLNTFHFSWQQCNIGSQVYV